MEVSITFNNEELRHKLEGIKLSDANARKLLSEVGDDLLDFYSEDVFDAQGARSGGQWKALAPPTVLARTKGWGYYANTPKVRGKILIWTGRLKNGFNKTVTAAKLVISNRVPYFKYHQGGEGRLPSRPMLTINDEVVKKVLKPFQDFLNKQI